MTVPVDSEFAFVPDGRTATALVEWTRRGGRMIMRGYAPNRAALEQLPALNADLGDAIDELRRAGKLCQASRMYPYLTHCLRIVDNRTPTTNSSYLVWMGGRSGSGPTPRFNTVYGYFTSSRLHPPISLSEVHALMNDPSTLTITDSNGLKGGHSLNSAGFRKRYGDPRGRVIAWDMGAIYRAGGGR